MTNTMNTTKMIIAVLFTVISTVALAKEDAQVKVFAASEAGVYHVIFAGNTAQKVNITIYNARNERLYTETVKAEAGFKVPVNLKALPYGVYTVELTAGEEVYRETVLYRPNAHNVGVVYAQEDGKVKVNVTGADGKEVRVLIYDENNHLLVEDSIEGQFNFGRVYNFEGTGLHKAEVVVAYQNKVVSDQTVKF